MSLHSRDISNGEAWMHQLLHALPADGKAEIIIAKSSGVTFHHLERETILSWLRDREAKRRRIKVALFAVLTVVLASLLGGQVYISRLSGNLGAAVAELHEYDRLLSDSDEFPDVLSRRLGGSKNNISRLVEIKKAVNNYDRAFGLYVEMTRKLIASQNHSSLGLLKSLGLSEVDERVMKGSNAEPMGGFIYDDELDRIMSHYVDNDVEAMLVRSEFLDKKLFDVPVAKPLASSRVTSVFGFRKHPITGASRIHGGLDLVSYSSDVVMAAGAGVVTFAGVDGGYGNKVIVRHTNEIESVYAHLRRIDVKEGDVVAQGGRIGLVGNTGLSTGSHLHYEVKVNGRNVDPTKFFRIADYVQERQTQVDDGARQSGKRNG